MDLWNCGHFLVRPLSELQNCGEFRPFSLGGYAEASKSLFWGLAPKPFVSLYILFSNLPLPGSWRPRGLLELLGAPGRSWALLGASGRSWALLVAPGRSWALLGASGRSWALLGAPGRSWALLGAPGRSWALLCAPGRSWALLGAPWRSLALLGAPGRWGCGGGVRVGGDPRSGTSLLRMQFMIWVMVGLGVGALVWMRSLVLFLDSSS